MEITSEELKQKIENGDKIIVDFYADWCGPCQILKPIFERVAEETNEVELYTMNVDNNVDLVSTLGIRGIPTIKSFYGGKEFQSNSGVLNEQQIKLLVSNLING